MLVFTLNNEKEHSALIARFARGEDNIIAFQFLDLPSVLQILDQLNQHAHPFQLIFDTEEFDTGPSSQIAEALHKQKQLKKVYFQGANNLLLQALIGSAALNTIEVNNGEDEPLAEALAAQPLSIAIDPPAAATNQERSVKRPLNFDDVHESAPPSKSDNQPSPEHEAAAHEDCGPAQALHLLIDDHSVNG